MVERGKEKMKKIVTGVMTFIICFAILIVLERGIVCLIDGKIEKNSPLMTGYLADDLNADDRARTMMRLMMYTNLGEAYDVRLADGSWFMDENAIIISLSDQVDNDSDKSTLYMFHNDEIMADYRSYTSQSKHDYMIKSQGEGKKDDSFLYFELVIDEFYIDGEKMIPEKYTIYRLSDNVDGDGEFLVSPVKNGELTLPEMNSEAKHFLIQDNPEYEISGNAINRYVYKEESGDDEYSGIITVFNERDYSIEERRNRMDEAFLGKSVKKDLVGFKQFYNVTQPVSNELFGEGATIVASRRNVLFSTYGLTSSIVMLAMIFNTVTSAVITLIVCLVGRGRNLK